MLAPVQAAAGINQQINFQGRLLNAQGAVVPDGYYNMEFKIYQDGDGQSVGDTTGSPAGTLKWTEDWTNNGPTQGVEVKNGYLSVQLGSRTAFGSSVNWNSDTLWLSMQVGNTSSCTISTGFQADCGGDGEMTPMKRLSSTPYAINSGQLNGLTSAQFLQLAQGVQADNSNVSSLFLNKTGSGNIVELQNGGNDAFVVGNTGDVSFGNSANHSISVATAAASAAGKSLTVAGGAAGSGAATLAGGNLVLNGGAGGGTNGNGGGIVIDGGVANGSGTNGSISIGANNAGTITIGKAANAVAISLIGGNGSNAVGIQSQASGTIGVGTNNAANTVQIGSTSLSSGTQTVNIGNNNTSGGTTNVTIGAGGSATGGTTAIQSKGNTTIATNGTLRATFDNLNSLYLGNGTTNASPNNFAITGTASSTSGTTGGTLTVKGGDSTAGNTNGGNLILNGGAGAGSGTSGSVIIKSNGSNSSTAFQVQKTDSSVVLDVDTSNGLIGLGAAPTVGGALVQVNTTLSAGTSLTAPSVIATTGVYTGASGGTQRIDASGNLVNIGNITGAGAVAFQGGTGSAGTTGGNGGNLTIAGGNGGNGTTTNGNGGNLTLRAGSAGAGAGTAGVSGSVIVANQFNSTTAFQIQNSTNSKAVMTVDTTNNQLVLGTPGVGGITASIKLYNGGAGSTGSTTLVLDDPGSSNYTLHIPSGGGTICTTANGLCSGSGGSGTGLAKNAVDTSSADAGTGYLYTFSNSGNAETGGVLSLDNGNNSGPALFLKDTSANALQVQNASSYNALVLDTSGNPAHLKIYDGTATAAYADISYNDSASSAIYTASAGTAQFGGGSVPTLLTAGSGQAVNITGHTDSNWVLDSGNLAIDVTGTTPNLNIGTGTQAKTVNIGNQTGATAINIKSGSGNINFIPVGTGNTGVVVKPTNASTLAFQVQNSSTNKTVMSVDNSGNQVVIGDGSASGITGQLAFSYAGASGKILLKPSGSPGASTFTLQLPSENGTLCTTAGSAACLAVYGGGTAGNFIAKDAVDTSSADSGAGALLTFTNSGSGGSGNVLKLNNGTNTGSTLVATTTGNPGAGKAVIYAENKNATPTGNLIDLESGSTPTSVFNVDASGNVVSAGSLTNNGTINSDTLSGTALTFGGASAALIQSAATQALNITGHTDSTWSLDAGNLTLQTSGASSTLAIDAGTAANGGTLTVGTNATTLSFGTGTANQSLTIGGSSGTNTIAIGNNASATNTITVGNANATTSVSILSGPTGAINIGSVSSSNKASTVNIASTTDGTSAQTVHIGSAANAANSLILEAGNTGTIAIGNGTSAHTINIGSGGTAAQAINIGSTSSTSKTVIYGGLNGSNETISLQTAAGGVIGVGTINGSDTINIGSTSLSTGTQTISLGASNTSGGTTNVTIGAGGSATGGTTAIQSKGNTTIATNGVTRATFDTTGSLYLGNGVSSATPANFTIRGTDSTTSSTAGSSITIQGGSATVGSANGGNVTISGGSGIGSGVNGLVLLSTPTFQTTTNDPNCFTGGALVTNSCTIASSSVNGSGAILVGFNQEGQTAILPAPAIATAGRIVYVTAANGSKDFTLEVNGGGQGNDIAMRQNTSATMIWNGSGWTAAGASSSTTLQAAYDNTLQSAGGAELVVSKTTATNGLTIRDSLINPVNGTLLSVQTNSAATLISVNGNVTEYASDAGAETAGGTTSTFPSGTWATVGGATVSRYTVVGDYIATGEGSVSVGTTAAANDGVSDTLTSTLTSNMHYNVSFAARLSSGTFTDMSVYYSVDGSTASVACITGKAVTTSIWTKVNCTFAAPSSGATSSNAILIRQASAIAHSFYIDNLSVTIAADYNYATDGGVDDNTNFATNWTAVSGATVTHDTSVGNDASDSARVDTTATGQGVRNKLSINPLQNTLYRVTVYSASTTAGFNSFTVRYSPNGGTNFTSCADYNTQSISSSTTDFVKVTCYIDTDATTVTSPYVYFTQSDGTARTFYVDTFSITLSTDTTPNVQIGGGVNGGPVTLLTLDRAASAPIASNNDAFLGSMYYDTTLGKLQCYEADGWGACGSSPDTIVTISPEYTNAVMHGTGIGTMTSDICSDTLHVNDGTSGQPTICGTNETYNFYKWTSPQSSAQTYSIYVTYELPGTFKTFASGQTSIMGRTDSNNATVQYSVYKEDSSTGLTQCGPVVAVSSGVVGAWQIGIASGAADPSTCGFAPNDSLVFKIDVIASQDADAYVGNLNFTFSNK